MEDTPTIDVTPKPMTRARRRELERRAKRQRLYGAGFAVVVASALVTGLVMSEQENPGARVADRGTPAASSQGMAANAQAAIDEAFAAYDGRGGEARPVEISTGVVSDHVQWPVDLRQVNLTDGFGMRVHPVLGTSGMHWGQDYAGPEGTRIGSIAKGTVIDVRGDADGLGTHVVIEHKIDGKKVRSVYGHMVAGSTAVNVGDKVEAGQLVGLMGSTGWSTGPHLHLEVIVEDRHVDPQKFLKRYADGDAKVDIFGELPEGVELGNYTETGDGWSEEHSETVVPPTEPVDETPATTPAVEPTTPAPTGAAPSVDSAETPAPATTTPEVAETPDAATPGPDVTEAPVPSGQPTANVTATPAGEGGE